MSATTVIESRDGTKNTVRQNPPRRRIHFCSSMAASARAIPTWKVTEITANRMLFFSAIQKLLSCSRRV